MTLNHESLWNQCLNIIKDNVPELSYSTWFIPIVPLQYEDKALLLQVPSHFFYEQLENQYADLIGKAILRVTGENTRLLYQVMVSDTPMKLAPDSHQANVNRISGIPTRPVSSNNPFEQMVPGKLEPQLNSNLSFGNFIGGESNMLARTAGYSIAEKPGKTIFNPLFVHGKSGVGKPTCFMPSATPVCSRTTTFVYSMFPRTCSRFSTPRHTSTTPSTISSTSTKASMSC
jgi:chromosomal replication initiator protein